MALPFPESCADSSGKCADLAQSERQRSHPPRQGILLEPTERPLSLLLLAIRNVGSMVASRRAATPDSQWGALSPKVPEGSQRG